MDRYAERIFSWRLKAIAWFNISVQLLFPIAVGYTPAALSADENTFIQRGVNCHLLDTQAYVLSEGETTQKVAHKFNMSMDDLRKLNQFRIFAKGFDNLQPGDDLEVPLAPLPEVQWTDSKKVDLSAENRYEQILANVGKQAGSFLSSNPNSDKTSSLARSMATSEAGSHLQQWLSKFSTARVQLNLDDRFSLNNTQLDVLVPLFEQRNELVFTQGSAHRTDSRFQTNLGLGYRLFDNGSMFGGNAFLDKDISRNHTRVGVGAEYWRDFLKLGMNSY